MRTLDLGHQRAGLYQNRARAAYWDGKNAVGEPGGKWCLFLYVQSRRFYSHTQDADTEIGGTSDYDYPQPRPRR